MAEDIYVLPEKAVSLPLVFNEDICTGCNSCVDVCQVDLLAPHPCQGKPPLLLFPSECWYCGCCVAACPQTGAIELKEILANRIYWRSKVPNE